MAKRVGGRGSAPDPTENLQRSPDPLVGWGGTPLANPTSLSALGASMSRAFGATFWRFHCC